MNIHFRGKARIAATRQKVVAQQYYRTIAFAGATRGARLTVLKGEPQPLTTHDRIRSRPTAQEFSSASFFANLVQHTQMLDYCHELALAVLA